MKSIVKFKFQGKEGFLSVVDKGNNYYALVQKDTPKVREIQDTKNLWISFDLKSPDYKEVYTKVLFDQEITRWVYEQLKAEKNLYFKELDDSLCVLEFAKKQD